MNGENPLYDGCNPNDNQKPKHVDRRRSLPSLYYCSSFFFLFLYTAPGDFRSVRWKDDRKGIDSYRHKKVPGTTLCM